jgi:hypothetical protein
MKDIIGKTVKEAEEIAFSLGLTVRLTRLDEDKFVGTCDLRMDRVNVEIEKGKVVKAYVG